MAACKPYLFRYQATLRAFQKLLHSWGNYPSLRQEIHCRTLCYLSLCPVSLAAGRVGLPLGSLRGIRMGESERSAVEVRDPENFAGTAAGVGAGERRAPVVAVRTGDFDKVTFHRHHLVAFDGE